MTDKEATVGARVRTLVDFAEVPKGSEGVIDEDYGTGVMVAWDLPGHPLPKGYKCYDGQPAIRRNFLRDGFNKAGELRFLEKIS